MQDISICQSGRTNYSIQCSYGNNSGVRGCGFVLVSREGENVMGYMEWDWDRGVVLDLPSFDYDNVLVFTLEEGNRIGGVPFRKSNSLIKFCVEYERKGTFYSLIVVQFYPLSVCCLFVCLSIHPPIHCVAIGSYSCAVLLCFCCGHWSTYVKCCSLHSHHVDCLCPQIRTRYSP